ncbi:tetratricopeptide repeat protein [Dactylosporangium sp. NPDC049525]|uniref:ATP-binding protein n=1 Tax=Dactylosporangium sp. NPDC049525 TaxID=3154730 RepID=UPI00343EA2E1
MTEVIRVFGDIVRGHRRRLGLSQEEVAGRSGVSVRGLRKIETGRIAAPRPTTVRLLADVFGLKGADRDRFCAAAHTEPPELPGPPEPPGPPDRNARRHTAAPPAQLPADVTGFVGRADALRRLDALLDGDTDPAAVVITTIAGSAGVGKTALAVYWAHRVAERFGDGQLYVNLRGFDPGGQAMDPTVAVRRFLDALGVPAARVPADPDAQAALYRSELAGRRMLIVLDNARDTAQVRPLLPGTPTCLVVVTSRNQLSGLVAASGAHPVTLDLFSPAEATELLTRRLGAGRTTTEPGAVAEIITACARLPLALAIVAARAATHPHLPLHGLAGELRHTGARLDTLTTDDPSTDLRAVFSWSYQALSPDAARLFLLLGLHPGPDCSAPAAASLAAVTVPRIRLLLAELTQANLIVEPAPGRYTFHDLLRAYAADLARGHDTGGTHRILDHYLHTAYTAARLLYPVRTPIALAPPAPGTVPEQITEHEQALVWFAAEQAVLLGAVHHAAATGFDTHTWQLAWAVEHFLDRRGRWHDHVTVQHAAVAAARRLANPSAQAHAHRHLALAYIRLEQLADADVQLRHAQDLYRQDGDLTGQAHAQHTLAHVRERQGRLPEAREEARRSLALYEAAGDRHGQANALNGVGWYHALLGDHASALAACEQALAILQEFGDRRGQAHTWDSIGYAHQHLGHPAEAIACYRQSLELFREFGERYYEATVLDHLGDTHHAGGDEHAARDAWRAALSIYDQLDHPDAAQLRAKLA